MILSYGGAWFDEHGVAHGGNVRRVGGQISGYDVVDAHCGRAIRSWSLAANRPVTCIACFVQGTL